MPQFNATTKGTPFFNTAVGGEPKSPSKNETVVKKPPLGSGERFKALATSLKEKGVRNPEAVAASIGRKKYGVEKFQKLAAKGR